MKIILNLLLIVFVSSCSSEDSQNDHSGSKRIYKSLIAEISFSDKEIQEVEKIMINLASEFQLEYFEKDKRQMALLNRGNPSFFISLSRNDNTALVLTNVVASDLLDLKISDHGDLAQEDLDSLILAAKRKLERRFGIGFQDKDLWTARIMNARGGNRADNRE